MKKNKCAGKTVAIGTLCIVLVLYMSPIYLAIVNSFKSLRDIMADALAFPSALNLSNYTKAFTDMRFPSAFVNSFLITVACVVVICFFTSMAAHFFLRNKWTLNKIIFALMVAAMIIPFQSIMIPMVRIYGSLGILNSRITLVFLYLGFGTPMSVFMYHGFMKGIPVELEEAATIDGCNKIKTFLLIVFPLLKPVTASLCILNALWIWNDYLLPFIVLKRPEQRTLPLATFGFYGTHTADYGLLLAALVMSVIPIMILYLFLQKYIQAGIVQGAVK